eukprot:6193159-Pleurochrysis_carterae.AAC.2
MRACMCVRSTVCVRQAGLQALPLSVSELACALAPRKQVSRRRLQYTQQRKSLLYLHKFRFQTNAQDCNANARRPNCFNNVSADSNCNTAERVRGKQTSVKARRKETATVAISRATI